MRLVAHLVVRDEAGRHLAACLRALAELTSEIHVFDDRSTDATRDVAAVAGACVSTRPEGVPSFLENEGAFREAGWRAMEATLHPDADTWVLVPDADEFFATFDDSPVQAAIRDDIADAGADADVLLMRIPEVFGWDFDQNRPLVRTDGFWRSIGGFRVVRWSPAQSFAPGSAGGSAPYAHVGLGRAERTCVLHVGYLRWEDRVAKQARYQQVRGHNPTHVASITRAGHLEPWLGSIPKLGVRS